MYGQGKLKRIIRSRFAKRAPLTVNTKDLSKVLFQPGVRNPRPVAVQTRFPMEIGDTLRIMRIIELFTDTAAILNKLDLKSITGCPGRHEHITFSIYERLLGHFVLKFS